MENERKVEFGSEGAPCSGRRRNPNFPTEGLRAYRALQLTCTFTGRKLPLFLSLSLSLYWHITSHDLQFCRFLIESSRETWMPTMPIGNSFPIEYAANSDMYPRCRNGWNSVKLPSSTGLLCGMHNAGVEQKLSLHLRLRAMLREPSAGKLISFLFRLVRLDSSYSEFERELE